MKQACQRLTGARWFESFMIGLIVFNGVLIGMETSPALLAEYGGLLHALNDVILALFVLEALAKMGAVAPDLRRYFGDGWNLFDFTVVVLSLIPATGEFALVARLVRILRVLRLVSAVPQLRLIVATLVRSIPGMGHVIALLGIIFYVYAVAGYHLFHEVDAERWGSLGTALLTLFRIVTLEGWTEVMYDAMQTQPHAWIYFVSFVLLGTFIAMNLFIAVIINNLEESKAAQLEELIGPASREEILQELKHARDALHRLESRLAAHGSDPDGSR
jgi:voltage-gated sodium channel